MATTDDDATSGNAIDVAPLALFVEERREREFDETLQLADADGTPIEMFVDGLPVVELVSSNEIAA